MEENDGRADNDEEITILAGGQPFTVRKSVICEHSDFYRAMFSSRFADSSSTTFTLHDFDAGTMGLMIQYMDNTLNLDQHSKRDIIKLYLLSNYLQTTVLIRRIEDHFCLQLTPSNCLEYIDLADEISSLTLVQYAAAYALLSFDRMRPEYIPSISKLYWYLSHPYLHAKSELDIFNFGFQWMQENEREDTDMLKVILCCLDLGRLSQSDCSKIQERIKNFNSPGKELVDCLSSLIIRRREKDLLRVVLDGKADFCTIFSESLYNTFIDFIESSPVRESCVLPLIHTREPPLRGYKIVKGEDQYPTRPETKVYQLILKGLWCVSESSSPFPDESFDDYFPEYMRDVEQRRPNMYAYTGSKLAPWLESPLNDLAAWSIAAWGLTKLVVVGGSYTINGLKTFMRDVWVYNTIVKQWTNHGVELPCLRHAGVAILENSLFIVGLHWGNETISVLSIVYDLERRTYRNVARFPMLMTDDTTSSPRLCAHEGHIYGIGEYGFYNFFDNGPSGEWQAVVCPIYNYVSRPHFVVSYAGYICYVENNASYPYNRNINTAVCRFQTGAKHRRYIHFRLPPIDLCCTGDRLVAFTEKEVFKLVSEENAIHKIAVEDHTMRDYKSRTSRDTRVLWGEHRTIDKNVPHGYFYNNGRCCAIASINFQRGLIPVCPNIPEYHRRCLAGHQRELEPVGSTRRFCFPLASKLLNDTPD